LKPYGPGPAGASLPLLRARHEPLVGSLSKKVLDVLLSESFELQWVHLSSFWPVRCTQGMDKGGGGTSGRVLTSAAGGLISQP